MKGSCPECAAELTLAENLEQGEIVSCSDCGVDLEVTAVAEGQATLAMAPEEDEDWGE